MISNDITNKILANTFTKNDFYKRILLVQDFISRSQFAAAPDSVGVSDTLRGIYGGSDEEATVSGVSEWGEEVIHAVSDPGGEAVKELKQFIAARPDVVLYVPTIFDQAQIRMIGEWCRSNIGPDVFLDLRVDKMTVGGCTLVWKNVLYDFSLEYYTRKHHDELSRLLTHTFSGSEMPAVTT